MGTLPCRPTLKTPGDMKVFGSFLCSPSRGVTKSVNRRPSFPIHCLLSSSPTFPDVFLALPQYLYKKTQSTIQSFTNAHPRTGITASSSGTPWLYTPSAKKGLLCRTEDFIFNSSGSYLSPEDRSLPFKDATKSKTESA